MIELIEGYTYVPADRPEGLPRPMISSIRIERTNDKHTYLGIWNRGAKAGTIVVDTDDAIPIIRRMIPRTAKL